MAEPDVSGMLRVQRMIHLGMISSLMLYGGVALTIMKQPLVGAPLDPMVAYIFLGVALMETAMLPILRGRMLPPETQPSALDQLVPPTTTTATTKTIPALNRLFSTQVMTWAVCESMAVFGIIVVLLGRQMNWFYALTGLSLVNLILYRPTAELIANAARIDAKSPR